MRVAGIQPILFLPIITSFFLAEQASGQIYNSKEVITRNRIKAQITWSYLGDSTSYPSVKYSYDSLGNLRKEFVYIIEFKTYWNYDNLGNVIEQIDSGSVKKKGHLKYLLRYDSVNRLSKRIRYIIRDTCSLCDYPEGIPDSTRGCQDTCIVKITTYSYGASGLQKESEKLFYRNHHYETDETEYKYDTQGHLRGMKQYNEWTNYYYRRGKLIHEEKCYLNSPRLQQGVYYSYNGSHQLIRKKVVDSNGPKEYEEYEYNPDGSVKSLINRYHNKKIRFREKYTYEYR
jgi:hypothetical protein